MKDGRFLINTFMNMRLLQFEGNMVYHNLKILVL